MKINLIAFQDKAVKELRFDIAEALESYRRRQKTQVISLQAPTGSGKTIIAAALIESIFFGITLADGTTFAEQPDAIFVWLSDSPELNEQSKQKIELKSDRLRLGQCVTITEQSFDMEMLEDGHIYFLNTQKITSSGKLTQHSDGRNYTIWETLDNTVRNKSDRLYFIIDEAHRGAKTKKEAGRDTTIMQRFIRGFQYNENGFEREMRPMPVVLGISATAERFKTLIGSIQNVVLQNCLVTSNEVRKSGLLKERIFITYPEDPQRNNEMVLLQAAVDEWIKKCKHWRKYTTEQHYANVDPILVIQVRQGSKGNLSDTDLDDVLAKLEEKTGPFEEGEVVHCFGDGATIEINGLPIHHVKASEIADDHKIKVVLFKEALSTGWDCPRAETMMSFAVRNDPTYIAQLLGRMVRTPLQMRVARDEFLNDVKLYLPYFDKETVKEVVDDLQSNEGGDIPTEINGESLEEPTFTTWTARPPQKPQVENNEFQPTLFNPDELISETTPQPDNDETDTGSIGQPDNDETDTNSISQPSGRDDNPSPTPPHGISDIKDTKSKNSGNTSIKSTHKGKQLAFTNEIDRVGIIDYINSKGFLTYAINSVRINDYLKSLLDFATLLTHNEIYHNARNEVIRDVISMIRNYIDALHRTGHYERLASQVEKFKLSVQVFDPFGKLIQNDREDLFLSSDTDIDRQLRNADAKLGRFGFPTFYGKEYFNQLYSNEYKIDCILFAAEESSKAKLNDYAKKKLSEFVRRFRVVIANKSDSCKREYKRIMADSDLISKQNFVIPDNITVRESKEGKDYANHLLLSETTSVAKIKLNGWESELIEEETRHGDFVCWLRNPSGASWALRLPYEKGGKTLAFFPDFLIIRAGSGDDYVIDILEPHGNQYTDNLPKAKALAKYAKDEPRFGRIQLIHKDIINGESRFVRLELTDMNVQEKVLLANTDDELTNIFKNYGILS